ATRPAQVIKVFRMFIPYSMSLFQKTPLTRAERRQYILNPSSSNPLPSFLAVPLMQKPKNHTA
ncbi:MAG: hypothetical protein ACYC3N_11360, partial [Halothiobacillus sp.]